MSEEKEFNETAKAIMKHEKSKDNLPKYTPPEKVDKWVLVNKFAEAFKDNEKSLIFLLLWGMFMWFAGLVTGILMPL